MKVRPLPSAVRILLRLLHGALLIGALHTTTGCHHHHPELAMPALLITGEQAPADISGRSAAEILELAVTRRVQGDIAGARLRLQTLLRLFPDSAEVPAARYQLALCFEREEAFRQAEEQYTILVRAHPDSPEALDAWFRRALCLEYLGDHREALRSLSHISNQDLPREEDLLILDLQRGISRVRAGRVRSGLRLMDAALNASQDESKGYLKAKAHVTRARLLLQDAQRLHLRGGQKRSARQLETRARLIQRAEQEVATATTYREPEWILEGLLILGQAYLSLHEDLLASRPPRRLSKEARIVYEREIAQRAQVLQTKAWRHFDEGISLAGRLFYQGRPLPALIAARDGIQLSPQLEER